MMYFNNRPPFVWIPPLLFISSMAKMEPLRDSIPLSDSSPDNGRSIPMTISSSVISESLSTHPPVKDRQKIIVIRRYWHKHL